MKNPFTYIKQLIADVQTFYKDLLSNESDTSSKRYVLIGAFWMLCIQGLLNQIFGFDTDLIFPILFASIATGTAILSVIEKFKT